MKPGSEVQVCTEWLQKWALWSKADVGLGCGSPGLGVEQQQLLLGGCVAAFLFIRAVSGSDGCWLPSLLKLPVSSAERAAGVCASERYGILHFESCGSPLLS